MNVLIISWRSFSGNPGKPNETNLYGDAKKAVKWLNDKGVETENIILYGIYGVVVGLLMYVWTDFRLRRRRKKLEAAANSAVKDKSEDK